MKKSNLTLLLLITFFLNAFAANAKDFLNVVIGTGNGNNFEDLSKIYGVDQGALSGALYSALTFVNKDGQVKGRIAKKWKLSNDGKTYTFFIDPNAKFSNGKKITVDDVIFSLNYFFWDTSKNIIKLHVLAEPDLKPNQVPMGIQKIDDKSFSITLKKPFTSFLRLQTTFRIYIFSKEAYLNNKWVGSGNYYLAYYKDGYSRFDSNNPNKYYKTLHVYEDKHVGTKIKASKIDITTLQSSKKFSLDNFIKHPLNRMCHYYILINPHKEYLQNVSNRRHLATLLRQTLKDKDDLKVVPRHTHLKTFIPKGVLNKKYYKQDLYKNDSKNNNQNISQNFTFLTLDLLSPLAQKEIADTLAKHGANVNFISLKNKSQDDMIQNSSFDFSIFGFSAGYPDPNVFLEAFFSYDIHKKIQQVEEKFFAQMEDINTIQLKKERTDKYSDFMIEFEKKYYVVPLWQCGTRISYSPNIKFKKAFTIIDGNLSFGEMD